MLLGYDTEDRAAATAATLIHTVYASRDIRRLKVDTDFWGRIERFVKGSAKRAGTLPEFVERLKPRLGCDTLRPVGEAEDGGRAFITGLLARPLAEPEAVLRALYRETSLCVLLVRDRIERERAAEEAEGAGDEPARKPHRTRMPQIPALDLFAANPAA